MSDVARPAAPNKLRKRSEFARIVRWSGVTVMALLAIILCAFFISGCAAFGSKPACARLLRAQQSPEWRDDRFENVQPRWSDSWAASSRLLFSPSTPNAEPSTAVPVVRTAAEAFVKPSTSGLQVTWFGHSSVLVEIDGSNVLIDPFWSERTSPVTWAGPKRWYAPPARLDELPEIDVVIISHDHVDHLDYATISAMKPWRTIFVVPLGVGAHLSGWGIPESRVVELDWWQSTKVGGLEFAATPARHASGRLSTKSNRTLWTGYAIIGSQH